MTAGLPIWMALPPEVHSALLSAGAGPGPLLAAADAWSALGAHYAEAADQLVEILAAVQSGAWHGRSADSYLAAHAPYVAWLNQAAADSAAAAARHETAAAAYVSAVAAMPTLAELAANHTAHGALAATNFFGINTIPIALNEADYVRMWVQAATTMSTYEAVSGAAVAAAPQPLCAPQIVRSHAPDPADDDNNPLGLPQWLVDALEKLGIGDSQLAHDPTINTAVDQAIAHLLRSVGYHWDPAAGTLNGFDYDYYSNPAQLSFWVARALELLEDFQYFGQLLNRNPVQAIAWFISWQLFDFPTHILEVSQFLAQNPALFVALAGPAVAPRGAAGGAAGLAGLATLPAPGSAPMSSAPVPGLLPALGSAATPAVAPPPAPAPAPAAIPAGAGAGGAPPPPPAAAASPGAPFFPPYLVGPPGIGTGSGMPTRAGASRKAGEPHGAAAAATTPAAADSQRARRRRRARLCRPDDADLDRNVTVTPDWAEPADPRVSASPHAALGFTGTAAREGASAAGLTLSTGGAFDDEPRLPLLPAEWPEAK
ncbi:hypothetical protein A5735_05320 [Mycolicibacter heraklionensis]|nr:hypothetical protein A5735_05320 [Mycolicibacter heraklionensis]